MESTRFDASHIRSWRFRRQRYIAGRPGAERKRRNRISTVLKLDSQSPMIFRLP